MSHLSRKMMTTTTTTTTTHNEEYKQTGSNCAIYSIIKWYIPEEQDTKDPQNKPHGEGREQTLANTSKVVL